jgi:hypothetical protein
MAKHKPGLQKDFAAIFDGVWFPKKESPTRQSGNGDGAQTPANAGESSQTEPHQADTPGPAAGDLEQARRIARRITCAKDFECLRSGLTRLCKARLIGNSDIIECSPENKTPCDYRITFAGKSFCKCRLRLFIAKKLGK